MIGLLLEAKNSKDDCIMSFSFDTEHDELNIRIIGKIDGKESQIDFDSLSLDDAEDLVNLIDNKLAKMRKKETK